MGNQCMVHGVAMCLREGIPLGRIHLHPEYDSKTISPAKTRLNKFASNLLEIRSTQSLNII